MVWWIHEARIDFSFLLSSFCCFLVSFMTIHLWGLQLTRVHCNGLTYQEVSIVEAFNWLGLIAMA